MQAISAGPAHLLLNRKDNPADHSTRPAKTGAASAFSSYAFGPLDLPDAHNGADVYGSKGAVTGSSSISSATGGNVGWLTQLAASQSQKY